MTFKIRLSKGIIKISLDIQNNGMFDDSRPATVVAVQNGLEVFSDTKMVSDPVGPGRTRALFDPFTPEATGDIVLTVRIDDDDSDIDEATAKTTVAEKGPKGPKQPHKR